MRAGSSKRGGKIMPIGPEGIEWLVLLRRAFEIPDIVSEDGARHALIRRLWVDIDLSTSLNPPEIEQVKDALLASIVVAGGRGQLDELFAESDRSDPPVPLQAVRDGLYRILGVENPLTAAFGKEVNTATERALKTVAQFVASHPQYKN